MEDYTDTCPVCGKVVHGADECHCIGIMGACFQCSHEAGDC